jgi:hypothetical protein
MDHVLRVGGCPHMRSSCTHDDSLVHITYYMHSTCTVHNTYYLHR